MATCSSILDWGILQTEEPGGLQSMGSQNVRCNLETKQQPKKGGQDFHNLLGGTALRGLLAKIAKHSVRSPASRTSTEEEHGPLFGGWRQKTQQREEKQQIHLPLAALEESQCRQRRCGLANSPASPFYEMRVCGRSSAERTDYYQRQHLPSTVPIVQAL